MTRELIPVVCDLTDATDTAAERVEEYRRLFSEHLVGRQYENDRVRFRFRDDAGIEAWVRDLAAREARCCAFFNFTVAACGGEVVWDATVGDDDAARAMLREWAQLPDTIGLGLEGLHDRWVAEGLTFSADPLAAPVQT